MFGTLHALRDHGLLDSALVRRSDSSSAQSLSGRGDDSTFLGRRPGRAFAEWTLCWQRARKVAPATMTIGRSLATVTEGKPGPA